MFEKWEAQKPLKDRRKCPIDPMKGISFNPNMSIKELDEINASAQLAWSEQALVKCQNCSRTFLPTQLVIHQKSCKSDNPAKSITGNYQTSMDLIDTSNININSGNLIPCQNCGRKFNPPSYVKHAKICIKVFSQKRKPFDSSKHRAMGTDLEEYQHTYSNNTKNYSNNKNKKVSMNRLGNTMNTNMKYNNDTISESKIDKYNDIPKWKLDSMRFREAMRASRAVSKAEKQSKATGIPLHILLPPSSSLITTNNNHKNNSNSSYNDIDSLYCPTCGRTFSQKAGERHIPQCKNIINKPKVLLSRSGLPSYSPSTTTVLGNNKTLDNERKNSIKMNSSINSNSYNIMNNNINSTSNSDKTRRNSFGSTNYSKYSSKQLSNTTNTTTSLIRSLNNNSSGSTRNDSDRNNTTSISKSKVSFDDIKTSSNKSSYDMNPHLTSNNTLHMSINNTHNTHSTIQYNNKANVPTSSGLGYSNNTSKTPQYQLQQCNQTSPDNPFAIKRFK